MTNADLRSALTAKWDEVVTRTRAAGVAFADPAGEDVTALQEVAVALAADADVLAGQFPGLDPDQQQALSDFTEAVRVRAAAILQSITGLKAKDVGAMASASFLWDQSGTKAHQAYTALD